ncbi:hypothetical protein KPH14_002377 [Odynerus spinipes]|uniref:Mitochondrial fission process protein 1 n=1 Tax=Odynerus spinipes TaxID=1348599 RepID=A0AAD9RLJ3_9HYME|nr:hypothetical protein KPH14_002377 [Odynerus spinipes]
MVNKVEEIDLFRDTPVRYLGYANEVGEAFRNLIPKYLVWLSYGVSSGYVLADTADKSYRVYKTDASPEKTKRVTLSAVDTLLWQSFASVIIPGFTINRLCAAVTYAQRKTANCALKNPWIPTLLGLISIPIIIHPIDNLVEGAMNATFRKWVRHHPKPKDSDDRDNLFQRKIKWCKVLNVTYFYALMKVVPSMKRDLDTLNILLSCDNLCHDCDEQ